MKRQRSIALEESLISFLEKKAMEERRSVSNLIEVLIGIGVKNLYQNNNTDAQEVELEKKEAA